MHKSKDVLNDLAKLASSAYLGKEKVGLNASLKKIAKSEGLNSHQIEYICSEANKQVWAKNFTLDKTAAYDFPLASPKEVIDALQVKEPQKISLASMDYSLPPSALDKTASADGIEYYGEFKTDTTKDDERRQLKKDLQSRYEKMAAAREDIAMKIHITKTASENAERAFIKEARQLIIQTPFSERASAIAQIGEFLSSAGHEKVGVELMGQLIENVAKAGLIKKADMKAPQEYISKSMAARTINGNHSLYITLNTIIEQRKDNDLYGRTYEIVDSRLPALKEKIREL